MDFNGLLCFSSLNSIGSDETKRHSVKSMGSESSSPGQSPLLMVDMKNFKALWNEEVYQNRERWKAQASKGTAGHVTPVKPGSQLPLWGEKGRRKMGKPIRGTKERISIGMQKVQTPVLCTPL